MNATHYIMLMSFVSAVRKQVEPNELVTLFRALDNASKESLDYGTQAFVETTEQVNVGIDRYIDVACNLARAVSDAHNRGFSNIDVTELEEYIGSALQLKDDLIALAETFPDVTRSAGCRICEEIISFLDSATRTVIQFETYLQQPRYLRAG